LVVTYADGTTRVLPGDRVSLRFLLRRRTGEVIYVPGISKKRGTYEHSGLTWVGVSLPDGWAVGEIVLPETGRLKPSVRFIGRGSESADATDAIKRLDQQESEEQAESVQPDERPVARPRPVDWFAGAVSIALHLGALLLIISVVVAAIVWLRRLL
jgi:hypothetical protein